MLLMLLLRKVIPVVVVDVTVVGGRIHVGHVNRLHRSGRFHALVIRRRLRWIAGRHVWVTSAVRHDAVRARSCAHVNWKRNFKIEATSYQSIDKINLTSWRRFQRMRIGWRESQRHSGDAVDALNGVGTSGIIALLLAAVGIGPPLGGRVGGCSDWSLF